MKGEKRFGDWIRTAETVGRGGLGDVWVAYHRDDTKRERPHALKQLRHTGSASRTERFQREVQAALRLDHPRIVKPVAYEFGTARPYYITQLYRNGHLTPALAAQMTPSERFRFFSDICRAVGYAHQERVVHRDLKPANVLIDDDRRPVVADLGLCFFLDADGDRLTETAEVAGSRFFTAPELAHGRLADVTPAADVYSLGKLLYWLFSGGKCFDREVHCDPRFDLRPNEPRIAHALVYQILDRTIVERPSERLQNGDKLADAVDTSAEALEMDVNVLDLEVRQHCIYCGLGEYKIRVDPRWWFEELRPQPEHGPNYWINQGVEQALKYGLQAHNAAPWLVLQCQRCGNVQTFQLSEGVDPLKSWNLKRKRG